MVSAVCDALAPLGVRHIDMPLKPERVWKAIASARTGQAHHQRAMTGTPGKPAPKVSPNPSARPAPQMQGGTSKEKKSANRAARSRA